MEFGKEWKEKWHCKYCSEIQDEPDKYYGCTCCGYPEFDHILINEEGEIWDYPENEDEYQKFLQQLPYGI